MSVMWKVFLQKKQKKWLTNHIEREHQRTESNPINVLENPNISASNNNNNNNLSVSAYENHRHVNIGPSNVGKSYYMLEKLEKTDNTKPIHYKNQITQSTFKL